jgi:hypothetical protein
MREDWEEWVEYDETSPSCLRWKRPVYCGVNDTRLLVAVGDVAGHLNKSGYWYYFLAKNILNITLSKGTGNGQLSNRKNSCLKT